MGFAAANGIPPDLESAEVFNCEALYVDIGRELGVGRHGRISVHACLGAELVASRNSVVCCDHGSGKIAEFIAVEQADVRGNFRTLKVVASA